MEYSLLIDQNFACRKDLTLTEAACMAVVFTFPRWCNSYCIDGVTYYWYSEQKVSEDFPLVFGCAKRVQKNLKALADKGYFILSKLGNKKVIAFTDKCRLYGKLEPENGQDLDRKRSEEPENGQDLDRKRSEETENGLKVDRKRSAPYIGILLVTMTIITINQITQKMAFLLSLAIYHKKRKEKKYAERRKRINVFLKKAVSLILNYSASVSIRRNLKKSI
ncbi:MAG: Putative AphA-like transcriptional regulator [Bacteriophage sp.]|nr:MAG: putative AphA-like transcriptional regulator [Bacteriophage sp.]UVN04615.1 MAG: putative AphA-like transcriptional regulator [Bacteriophage sp.]UVX76300.1 MAG: Putative AphA-like transcriptional regulator [Bacteriophage sp.]UVY55277.1 MAG: Putative AphA-like transcriptional regulator [Bacteriophage sp.]UWF90084.1 MAG: Putative AphA-like transcriptional regulator [Bacteriophage sp.]